MVNSSSLQKGPHPASPKCDKKILFATKIKLSHLGEVPVRAEGANEKPSDCIRHLSENEEAITVKVSAVVHRKNYSH